MKMLTDKQALKLSIMFDCVEMWAFNSRGCNRLWEENKELMDELVEAWYREDLKKT